MVTLTGAQVFVIVIAVVLTVVVVGIFLYLANRLRARRNQILGELSAKPQLIQDRAFNRLEMARREAAILARTGTDISRAQDLLAQSQSAFDLRQFPRAYELAQSAHEELVNARGRTAVSPGSPSLAGRSPAAPGPTAPRPVATGSAPLTGGGTPAPPPPKNRAESHFQLGLLQEDLSNAGTSGVASEAAASLQQGQAAFDRGDYTEAFRLALRGRRALGRVETLAPGPKGTAPASTSAAPVDAAGMAEQAAGASRCPDCGYPMLPGDGFCRGCGKPRTALTCGSCGEPRAPADTFCGRCGARFTA
ncbi:MAG TPA: zinc ribbon domain-containing protein [Thermoplasmata archaeon]|nr:zinc ribbon domain-containing protein [Thermoplasmata archaeon]